MDTVTPFGPGRILTPAGAFYFWLRLSVGKCGIATARPLRFFHPDVC
jgi:hypothetical protein